MTFLRQVRNSAVAWSWVYNALRMASGLILLPLVLNKLPTADLGMYYVLLSLIALVPLIDFGFAPTIGRFVTYAMAGAEVIQAQGVAKPGKLAAPNFRLLSNLLFATQRLYRYLTLILLVVLGAWGTYVVELRLHETSSPLITRLAWVVTVGTALFEIYTLWWLTYLRSMNEVLAAVKIGVLGMTLRLGIAALLLVFGGGLLSLPVSSFFGSIVQRSLARHRCLQLLGNNLTGGTIEIRELLGILWPNTWRLGLQFISGYLTINANTAICLQMLGLRANAQYGLSVQLLTFISSMSVVWVSVKWPLIGQYRAQHDFIAVQRVLRPRVWLQTLTFLVGSAAVLLCGPFALAAFGGGKQMLPLTWLLLLALNTFFEMQFNVWGTLLSTENRLPYLWPTIITNLLSLIFSLCLIHFTQLGLGALVLGPLLAGLMFNYWYWPPFAARSLGIGFFRLLFVGVPTSEAKR